jgi:hypothetical protein
MGKVTYTPERIAEIAEGLTALYRDCEPHHIDTGRKWYPEALQICTDMATHFGREVKGVVYALAALSPNCQWESNVKLCRSLAASRRYSNPGTFHKFAIRAWDCLRGAYEQLSGPKVTAFALAILGDCDAVVIDRWMFRACGHHRESCSPRQYEAMAQAVRRAARTCGETPRDFQAIIWIILRQGENNDLPQLWR